MKRQILIIDDNQDLAEMVSFTLRAAGFDTIMAFGGPDGLKVWKFHKDSIGLVIVDILMPLVDGYEVMREIKKEDPGIKIVAMSGTESGTEVLTRERCGCGIFLAKPFAAEDLLSAVQSLFK